MANQTNHPIIQVLLFNNTMFYCPICNEYYLQKESFIESISNEKTRWLANMVTHYRYHHIDSWANTKGRYGDSYSAKWLVDYDEEKHKINERAKRQIFKQSIGFIKEHGVGLEHLNELHGTDAYTLKIAQNALTKQTKNITDKKK